MSERKKTPSPDPIAEMHNNLEAYDEHSKDTVIIYSKAAGLIYLTVAVATGAGDAGGEVMTSSTPHRIMPGLNPVNAAYWARVEADVARQKNRSGDSITGQIVETKLKVIRDLEAMDAGDILDMMERSANIEFVGSLRKSPKHGENAARVFTEFWNHNASDEIKTLRHYWAQVTGSKKVA